MESSKPQYTVLVVNNDKGILFGEQTINHGNDLMAYIKSFKVDSNSLPLTVNEVTDKPIGIESLKNKKADALIFIDASFSQSILKRKLGDSTSISVVLTLLTAIMLGFKYEGSLMMMIIIACLTSLSIIAFSLIIAAITKTANEVLVVGNFPMFLFMFFTGAAFPLKSEALFTIADYPINIQGLMTPTHAISALNKTLIMNMDVSSIIPEVISIIVLTIIYFLIGGIIFKQRHLKLT